MELTVKQQILEYFEKSQNIVIVLPKQLSVDSVATAGGLYLFFNRLGKKAVVVTNGAMPPGLDFLTRGVDIQNKMPLEESLVVSLNTSAAKLGELSYVVEPEQVDIFLKAKTGNFKTEDVSVSAKGGNFDLIVILGAQNMEQLAGIYEVKPELFFELPKINIDTRPDNEYYGTINLVNVMASSLAEEVCQLLVESYSNLIDEDIASCLLTGIIAATHSFQGPQTTPQTLLAASQLVVKGGRQQEIIQNLYKTKDFALLKLWGRTLARIKNTAGNQLLYSVLNLNDFEKTGSTVEQLPKVLEELIDNVSGFQVIALIAELKQAGTRLVIAAPPHVSLASVSEKLQGQIVEQGTLNRVYSQIILDFPNLDLDEVENKLLNVI